MAKIGDLVTKLQIDGRTFENPEWWFTQHKLKKQIKQEDMFRTKIGAALYRVNSGNNLSADTFTKQLKASLDSPKYKDLAPWNKIFNIGKNIIIFK